MPDLFLTPIPPDKDLVRYEVREVVVDLHDKPHLLTRLSLVGPCFPQRSEEAYVTVGESVELVVPRPFQATRVMKLDLDRLRRAIPDLRIPD
jgi:hypothetical protein